MLHQQRAYIVGEEKKQKKEEKKKAALLEPESPTKKNKKVGFDENPLELEEKQKLEDEKKAKEEKEEEANKKEGENKDEGDDKKEGDLDKDNVDGKDAVGTEVVEPPRERMIKFDDEAYTIEKEIETFTFDEFWASLTDYVEEQQACLVLDTNREFDEYFAEMEKATTMYYDPFREQLERSE